MSFLHYADLVSTSETFKWIRCYWIYQRGIYKDKRCMKNAHKGSSFCRKHDKKAVMTWKLRRDMWQRWMGNAPNGKCYCCGLEEIRQSSCHPGHVIAVAEGGETTVDNLRPICQECNWHMHIKDMRKYVKINKLTQGKMWQEIQNQEELCHIRRLDLQQELQSFRPFELIEPPGTVRLSLDVSQDVIQV